MGYLHPSVSRTGRFHRNLPQVQSGIFSLSLLEKEVPVKRQGRIEGFL